MEIQKMSGEQLAELLQNQFGQLMQAQNNIRVINDELTRRKANDKKTVTSEVVIETPKE